MEVLFEVRAAASGQSDSSAPSLNEIISSHSDYIRSTTKGPLQPLTPEDDLTALIIEDEQKVCVGVMWTFKEDTYSCNYTCKVHVSQFV